MKTLTALFLLLSLVLPGSLVAQVLAVPAPPICDVVDSDGFACCEPAAIHCCCDAAPAEPAPPAPPLASPLPASAASDIAAALPLLLVLAELPRLSLCAGAPAPFSDRAPCAPAPPVRLCVLRCSLLI